MTSWGGILFLSTPSARRATAKLQHKGVKRNVSIHALREEGDEKGAPQALPCLLFLSTPSARRATVAARRQVVVLVVSIHALREEGDG